MAYKLLNLLAVTSVAILATSFGPTPVDALAATGHVHARSHHNIARNQEVKMKRDVKKRCKTRSSTAAATSTKAPAPEPTSSNAAPKPTSSSASSGGSSSGGSSSGGSSSGGNQSSGSGKVGLAWPNGDSPAIANFKSNKVSALYTWSPQLPDGLDKLGIEGIPMLWGFNQVDDFKKTVVKGYASTVLAMNEPNEPGQSNMSPQDGAKLYMQYINPLKAQGYRLGAPATSSNPNGFVWVQNFMKACDGCHFDFVPLHYYDVTPEGFIAYLNKWHDGFNLPVWVTETACQNFNNGPQCSKDQVFNYMNTITNFMESTPWVEKYFYFGLMHDMQGVNNLNQLMDSSNKPTALGSKYIFG